MKKKIASLLASAVALLCVAVTANASVYYSFDSNTSGWDVGSGVTVSNGAPTHGANSLYIPVNKSATNVAGEIMTNQVWTDFYTVPVRYSSATATAPAFDPSATAQFFVNSNGFWVTLSGTGCNLTNVCTQSLVAGLAYPTVTQYATFYHVSVLQNYTNKKWSLFVNNVPLAENLGFIDTAATSNTWFQAQNLGGNATNVCWIDDYLLTNAMVTTGGSGTNTLTAVIPGSTMSIVDAMVYFGTVEPRPACTNFGVATNLNENAVQLQFVARPSQQYVLVGGASPVDAMSGVSTVMVDSAATSNYIADVSALTKGSNQFYKVMTISQVDSTKIITNLETYAWYKQSRSTMNRWYYSGAPVVYDSSAKNSLAGDAGQQLAMGLHGDSVGNGPDLLYVGGATYYLNASRVWVLSGGATAPADMHLTPGVGVAIKRQLGAASSGYSVISGTWTNTIGSVNMASGWNSLSWPYDTVASSNDFPGETGDKFTVLRGVNGNPQQATKLGSGWKVGIRDLVAADWPQAGEGFMYYNCTNSTTWTPTR